jgi:hypothetical protein
MIFLFNFSTFDKGLSFLGGILTYVLFQTNLGKIKIPIEHNNRKWIEGMVG